MITGPSDHNWRFREGEEFRERVIRQAMLLGFEAEEYEMRWRSELGGHDYGVQKRWSFTSEGRAYGGYASCYSAALEFLRLSNFPMDKVGRLNE